jgi:mannose-6-phosphate isomerase-like protein (cupin superfamily)
MHVKVYAEGGENDLHAHPREDHAFVVLEGAARFFDGSGRAVDLAPYDGVLVPRGALYRFCNAGDGNLVMLRVGAGSNARELGKQDERVGPDGRPLAFNPSQVASGANLAVERGDWFPDRHSPTTGP